MNNGPFEDVFPIEDGDIPLAMLVYQRVLVADTKARVRSLPTLGMSEATLGMYKKCHGRIKANGVVTSSWGRLNGT